MSSRPRPVLTILRDAEVVIRRLGHTPAAFHGKQLDPETLARIEREVVRLVPDYGEIDTREA